MKRNNDGTYEFSPETAALLQRQFEIDYEEAGPKAPYRSVTYKGIHIESRWDVLCEFEVMKEIIDAMPELMARRLAWMWCDSKCGASYVIGVKPALFVTDLRGYIADAVMRASGGHNGITIEDGDSPFTGKLLAAIDCDWGEVD